LGPTGDTDPKGAPPLQRGRRGKCTQLGEQENRHRAIDFWGGDLFSRGHFWGLEIPIEKTRWGEKKTLSKAPGGPHKKLTKTTGQPFFSVPPPNGGTQCGGNAGGDPKGEFSTHGRRRAAPKEKTPGNIFFHKHKKKKQKGATGGGLVGIGGGGGVRGMGFGGGGGPQRGKGDPPSGVGGGPKKKKTKKKKRFTVGQFLAPTALGGGLKFWGGWGGSGKKPRGGGGPFWGEQHIKRHGAHFDRGAKKGGGALGGDIGGLTSGWGIPQQT